MSDYFRIYKNFFAVNVTEFQFNSKIDIFNLIAQNWNTC